MKSTIITDAALTRRDWMLVGTAAFAAGASTAGAQTAAPGMFTLPKLPYAVDALEPHIDARTMEIHHGKHHQAYVDNLNKAVASLAAADRALQLDQLLAKLDSLPEAVRTAVRNHGGGHSNHSLFWQSLTPAKSQKKPAGRLAAAIGKSWGGQAPFEEKLKAAAMTVFGSGWAWLCLDASNQLVIEPYPNQDSPLMRGKRPLFGIDVWEHAYYLRYQNRRADYLSALMNVVHWEFVSQRYEEMAR